MSTSSTISIHYWKEWFSLLQPFPFTICKSQLIPKTVSQSQRGLNLTFPQSSTALSTEMINRWLILVFPRKKSAKSCWSSLLGYGTETASWFWSPSFQVFIKVIVFVHKKLVCCFSFSSPLKSLGFHFSQTRAWDSSQLCFQCGNFSSWTDLLVMSYSELLEFNSMLDSE